MDLPGLLPLAESHQLCAFQNNIYIEDDFLGGIATSGSIGQLGWNQYGGVITSYVGIPDHPGVYQMYTTTAVGTNARLSLHRSDLVDPLRKIAFVWHIMPLASTASATIRAGLGNSATEGVLDHGIYFEKLPTDSTWFCVTRSGGVQTRTDSGIEVSGKFTTLVMEKDEHGSRFYIDRVPVGRHTLNLPTVLVCPWISVRNSAAVNSIVLLDYFALKLEGIKRT